MNQWTDAASLEELQKKRRLVVDTPVGAVLLLWHDDAVHAMANICIHKERELVKGPVLNGRLVCPGHQWAFDLATGYCREREQSQPVYPARVADGRVEIDLSPATP